MTGSQAVKLVQLCKLHRYGQPEVDSSDDTIMTST